MHVRDQFKLGPGTKIKVAKGGVLDIAGRGAYKSSHVLGESTIAAREKIVLDEGVGTGLGVLITDSDWHKISGRTENAPVVVGKNAYIATNCMILKGTVIGDDCVLGAATVIAGKTIPSGSLVAGNPGKVRAEGISWEF